MDNSLKKYRQNGVIAFRTRDKQFWDWLESEYREFVKDKTAGDSSAQPTNFFRIRFMKDFTEANTNGYALVPK